MTQDSDWNSAAYEALYPLLVAGLERSLGRGHSLRDFTRYCLRRLGMSIVPYLEQLYRDIAAGRARVAGLPQPAAVRPAVSEEARQGLIAQRAYFKAEARGFTGDSQRDWEEAEAEVDALLVQGIGPEGLGS
jgi:hypothetical protein